MSQIRPQHPSLNFAQIRELKAGQNPEQLKQNLAHNGLDEVLFEADGKSYLAVGESIDVSGLQGQATAEISLNGENKQVKLLGVQDDITSWGEGWSKGQSWGDSLAKAWSGLNSSPDWSEVHTVSSQVGRWPSMAAPVPVTPTPAPPPVTETPVTEAPTDAPSTESSKPPVEVFFTRNGGESPDKKLAEFILSANKTVDIAAFEIDSPTIRDAILKAHENHREVRIVTDSNYKDEPNIKAFEAAGIPVINDERSGLMHNKFVVIDRGQQDAAVWTGSMNLTDNGVYRNNNNAQIFRSKDLAENYSDEFKEMFEDHQFGHTSPDRILHPEVTVGHAKIETYFASEGNVAGRVAEELSHANKSIQFMTFSFTHKAIGQAVMDKFVAGKTVQGVFDNTQAGSRYSKYHELKAAGADVKRDGNPKIMHHKVFIIDGETVITGSFNFSNSANKSNDENLLIIHDKDIAHQYQEEFKRVYAETANNPENQK